MLKLRHELNRRRDWLIQFDHFLQTIVAHEDQSLMSLYADQPLPHQATESLRSVIADGSRQLSEYLFDLLDLQQEEPHEIRLLLISDDAEPLRQLTHAYWTIASEMGVKGELWQFLPTGLRRESFPEEEWTLDRLKWEQVSLTSDRSLPETWQVIPRQPSNDGPPKPLLLRQRVADPKRFLSNSLSGVLGLMCDFNGSRVFNRFVREDGQHRFHFAQEKQSCSVFTGLPTVAAYLPPFGIDRRSAVSLTNRCRDYDYSRTRMTDSLLTAPVVLLPGNLSVHLGPLLLQRHQQVAEALIE